MATITAQVTERFSGEGDIILSDERAAEQESAADTPVVHIAALNRRDFLKLAAVLAASTALVLSRCGPDGSFTLPPVPTNFKRFLLVELDRASGEFAALLARGTQFPDARCVVLWQDTSDFTVYASSDDVYRLHVRPQRTRFVWLD